MSSLSKYYEFCDDFSAASLRPIDGQVIYTVLTCSVPRTCWEMGKRERNEWCWYVQKRIISPGQQRWSFRLTFDGSDGGRYFRLRDLIENTFRVLGHVSAIASVRYTVCYVDSVPHTFVRVVC